MHTSRFAVAFSLAAAAATAGTVAVKPTGRYMAVPVENGAPKIFMEVFDGGTRVAYDQIEWARGTTNWTGSLDLRGFKGRALEFRFSGNDMPELTATDLKFADAPFPAPKGQYDEPWRPQFHFTPPLGWNNDPNGLSYRDGEWHMFYQHNPFGIRWGNMHWGHAVSKDLVHWQDLGDVIAPDEHGPMFSGSAVVDHENTAGFGKGAHVLIYTAAGKPRSQRVAWSLDGRNYVKWPNAAVADRPDANRDPKVGWYAPGKCWVMAVYGEVEKGRHGVSLFTSKDLKAWTLASHVPGDLFDEGKFLYECPDFFEMPIEGEAGTRWVLTAANRQYAIGMFDGRTFAPETTRLEQTRPVGGLNPVYAWQSFSDAPGGRRIQVAWSHFDTCVGGRTDAIFNQGMSLPMELKLVRTADGLRLARFPVKELENLRAGEVTALKAFEGELAEVEFACTPVADAVVTLDLRGVKIEYDAVKKTLSVRGSVRARSRCGHCRRIRER
ncbi:MAG: glycoside hydrolase family 32 protein [Kiritimatiellae bacterium]|nr:glycoside hydrolase family 32 protein [Kiritimatiellia bacterium]